MNIMPQSTAVTAKWILGWPQRRDEGLQAVGVGTTGHRHLMWWLSELGQKGTCADTSRSRPVGHQGGTPQVSLPACQVPGHFPSASGCHQA